ncbi:unnamed protein product [Paramecium sonneborni]|uniref:Uncharacterized protein n=1 Tax=Paramecium sonneborni TaxID=65129 RepID=A0A8S1RND0_9CILI|nr:unnamed protein product [Paramecium sonneborni]
MESVEVQHDGSSQYKKVKSNSNALNSLRDVFMIYIHSTILWSQILARLIKSKNPQNATTNPSLILEVLNCQNIKP